MLALFLFKKKTTPSLKKKKYLNDHLSQNSNNNKVTGK